MHLDPSQVPDSDNKLGWLAIMQHYGAPTRLLDFTYSPYVALYFALRNHDENKSKHAEVWGIDAAALREKAGKTSWAADKEIMKKNGRPFKSHRVSFSLDDFASGLQQIQGDDERWETEIRNALAPCGVRREYFNSAGFVSVASPPLQNARLSSQQGVFLLNGAEGLTFEESLELMMQGIARPWYKRFRALPDIEETTLRVQHP